MPSQLAAVVFAAVVAAVILFQLALAAGAPWGAYAMGGAFPGRYPAPMRVAAVLQAAILALLAVTVLSAAGIVLPEWREAAPWLGWPAVLVSALGVVLNSISRSAGERRIWVPVTLVMLATSLAAVITAG